jgi:hypothetical protein
MRLTKLAKTVLSSALIGVLYGALFGALFGSVLYPIFGSITGLLYGAIAGFLGGTVSGCLGPKTFGMGGVLGGIFLAFWLFSLMGPLALAPSAIGALVGMWFSSQLSRKNAEAYAPGANWLRKQFDAPHYSLSPLWLRCAIGCLILSMGLLVEWARIHFDVVFW